MRRLVNLGLWLGLAVCVCACPPRRTVEHAEAETTSRSAEVPPGKFVEVNLDMQVAARAECEFRVEGGVVQWNIHSHPGGDQVVTHEEGDGSEGGFVFTAATAGGYSFLWQNQGKRPVVLHVELTLSPGVHVASWAP